MTDVGRGGRKAANTSSAERGGDCRRALRCTGRPPARRRVHASEGPFQTARARRMSTTAARRASPGAERRRAASRNERARANEAKRMSRPKKYEAGRSRSADRRRGQSGDGKAKRTARPLPLGRRDGATGHDKEGLALSARSRGSALGLARPDRWAEWLADGSVRHPLLVKMFKQDYDDNDNE